MLILELVYYKHVYYDFHMQSVHTNLLHNTRGIENSEEDTKRHLVVLDKLSEWANLKQMHSDVDKLEVIHFGRKIGKAV